MDARELALCVAELGFAHRDYANTVELYREWSRVVGGLRNAGN
jgi:hypothetical protein